MHIKHNVSHEPHPKDPVKDHSRTSTLSLFHPFLHQAIFDFPWTQPSAVHPRPAQSGKAQCSSKPQERRSPKLAAHQCQSLWASRHFGPRTLLKQHRRATLLGLSSGATTTRTSSSATGFRTPASTKAVILSWMRAANFVFPVNLCLFLDDTRAWLGPR